MADCAHYSIKINLSLICAQALNVYCTMYPTLLCKR